MNLLRQLDAVPAYYALDARNRRIPFIVSLLLRDRDGHPRLAPAVEAAIDRTVEITGWHGLVTAIVGEQDTRASVARIVDRSMDVDGAILLFRCQNGETAEALMVCMSELFTLSRVRERGERVVAQNRFAKETLNN